MTPRNIAHPCGNREEAVLDDKLVDGLINELWGGNRPVLAWRSHFFQILRYDPHKLAAPSNVAAVCSSFAEDEERAYFLLDLQNLVAPAAPSILSLADDKHGFLKDKNRFRSFDRMLDRNIVFRVFRATDYPQGFEVNFTALRIHFFHDDLLAIEWEIGEGPTDNMVANPQRPLWCRLFCPDRGSSPLRLLAQIIEANARIRICYSSFCGIRHNPADLTHVELIEGGDPDRRHTLVIGSNVSNGPLDGWFRRLVELAIQPFKLPVGDFDCKFTDEDALRHYGIVWDERAHVVSSIVLEGNPPSSTTDAATRFEQLCARLHTVDPYGSGFFYSEVFSTQELADGSYMRYADFGGFYIVSSHSFTYCGFAGRFASEEIHGKHKRLQYRRMFMLALFYQASLDSFVRDIGVHTRELVP